MCDVCLLSHFIMSNTSDMTYFMSADKLISLLLLFSSGIFHYLSSLFLCLTWAVFTTAVSVLLKTGDKCFSVSIHIPWWYLEQGDVVKLIIGLWTSTTTLCFFPLNLYKELIRSIYHPGALFCCSCAHWLGLSPGSPSPKYSRCFIAVLPHHSQYNYELHLLLGTKQSLKLEITVTNGSVLTEYKL